MAKTQFHCDFVFFMKILFYIKVRSVHTYISLFPFVSESRQICIYIIFNDDWGLRGFVVAVRLLLLCFRHTIIIIIIIYFYPVRIYPAERTVI